MKIRVLLIDDEAESVEPLRSELVREFSDVQCDIVTFDDAISAINERDPQIVVLDLLEGGSAGSSSSPGLETRDYVWKNKFCPLIIYTAAPELIPDEDIQPFLQKVKKGSGSEEVVLKHIREYLPHVTALDGVAAEIRKAMNLALKLVAPRIWNESEAIRADMLTRAARRIVAARMDEALSTTGPPPLKSWELYLCPPVVDHLLTGDVVRRRDGDAAEPSSYAIVLTPSCDLVKDAARSPKVDQVLVARCAHVSRFLKDLNIEPKSAKKQADKIKTNLSQGYTQSCLPLPALPGVFPVMAADFRRLELAELNAEQNGLKDYERVASVDNPLRELFSWAYMQAGARPALPDRDREEWASTIIAAAEKAN